MKTVRVLVLVALTSLHTAAHADVIISFQEVGSDVVASYSGSMNLTGATFIESRSEQACWTWPSYGVFGAFYGQVDKYNFFATEPAYGADLMTAADASLNKTGDNFGFMTGGYFLPANYTSGASFSGTAFWAGKTFSSMGITPGTYTWTAGNNNMTLTTQAVPEPATSAMALVGLAYGTYSMLRRRKEA